MTGQEDADREGSARSRQPNSQVHRAPPATEGHRPAPPPHVRGAPSVPHAHADGSAARGLVSRKHLINSKEGAQTSRPLESLLGQPLLCGDLSAELLLNVPVQCSAREEAPDFPPHPGRTASFSHEGPDGNYFWLCGPCDPCHNDSNLPFHREIATTLCERGSVAIKLSGSAGPR